jgi:UPF0755 protein
MYPNTSNIITNPSPNKSNKLAHAIIAFILVASAIYFFSLAPQNFPVGSVINIPEKSTLNDISKILKENHVIFSEFLFKVIAYASFSQNKLQAGDYQFDDAQNSFSVAYRLRKGVQDIPRTKITIVEGSTVSDIAKTVKRSVPTFDDSVFVQIAKPYEGYLFPDTYMFFSNVTPNEVMSTMMNEFENKVDPLIMNYSSDYSIEDIIKMASIVEKEATNMNDRRMIAGILWKRIKSGMPLQVDPPFYYFLNKSSSELTLDDLKVKSPYNLYLNKGLPPTPICNPSASSIDASLNPTASQYWYYLSDKSGNMHYATTHAEHLVNKEKYLR